MSNTTPLTSLPTLEMMKSLTYELRLFGMHQSLQTRAQESLSCALSPFEYLRLVLEDEKLFRQQRIAKCLQTRAKFRSQAELRRLGSFRGTRIKQASVQGLSHA